MSSTILNSLWVLNWQHWRPQTNGFKVLLTHHCYELRNNFFTYIWKRGKPTKTAITNPNRTNITTGAARANEYSSAKDNSYYKSKSCLLMLPGFCFSTIISIYCEDKKGTWSLSLIQWLGSVATTTTNRPNDGDIWLYMRRKVKQHIYIITVGYFINSNKSCSRHSLVYTHRTNSWFWITEWTL